FPISVAGGRLTADNVRLDDATLNVRSRGEFHFQQLSGSGTIVIDDAASVSPRQPDNWQMPSSIVLETGPVRGGHFLGNLTNDSVMRVRPGTALTVFRLVNHGEIDIQPGGTLSLGEYRADVAALPGEWRLGP